MVWLRGLVVIQGIPSNSLGETMMSWQQKIQYKIQYKYKRQYKIRIYPENNRGNKKNGDKIKGR